MIQHADLIRRSRELVAASRDLMNMCRMVDLTFNHHISRSWEGVSETQTLIMRSDEIVGDLVQQFGLTQASRVQPEEP